MKEKRGSYAQPFGYTGYQYDNTSNLYFAQARYYDPALGRFVSEDRVKGNIIQPDTINPYIYCLSNPLKYVDLDGNEENDVDAILITYDEFPSHTSLLVQDPKNGDWYFFYWGPKEFIPALSPSSTDAAPIFHKLENPEEFIDTDSHTVDLDKLNKNLWNDGDYIFNTNKDKDAAELKAKGNIGKDFDQYVYYDGDYTETYNYLKEYLDIDENGAIGNDLEKYNLYKNNCADVSLRALLKGEGMSNFERLLLLEYYYGLLTIPILVQALSFYGHQVARLEDLGDLYKELCLI